MITKNEEKAARIQIYLEAQEDWLADIAEVLGKKYDLYQYAYHDCLNAGISAFELSLFWSDYDKTKCRTRAAIPTT